MVKLVWKVPGQAPLAFPLRQERISIGRDAGNDIRLPEPAVSSRHAAIIRKAGRVVLHDLKSSNGTWVNGARIDNQELVHGDMIAFGRVVMSFIDESQEAPPAPPPPAPTANQPPRRVVSPATETTIPRPAAPATSAPTPTVAPVLPPLAQSPPAPAATPPANPGHGVLSLTIPRVPATTSGRPASLDVTLPPLLAMTPTPPPPPTSSPNPDLPSFLPLDGTLPRLPGVLTGDTLPQPKTAAVDPSGPDLKELDRLLGSIRSFRDQETDVVRQRQAEMMREWRETLTYAEAMKQRLASESRIRFFDVSERRQEIVLRIVRSPGEPTRLLSLTWGHPDQRDKAPDGIWLRATFHPDRRYYKSAEAVRELVATLASFLA